LTIDANIILKSSHNRLVSNKTLTRRA